MARKSHNISIRLDTNTYNVIQALATKDSTSLSQTIRKHLRSELKRLGLLSEEVRVREVIEDDLKVPEGWE